MRRHIRNKNDFFEKNVLIFFADPRELSTNLGRMERVPMQKMGSGTSTSNNTVLQFPAGDQCTRPERRPQQPLRAEDHRNGTFLDNSNRKKRSSGRAFLGQSIEFPVREQDQGASSSK